MQINEKPSKESTLEEQDPYRNQIPILFIFSFAVIGVQCLFATCVTISIQLIKIYGISALEVSLTVTLQMICLTLCTFPSSWLIQKHGIFVSVRVGALLVISGLATRCLVAVEYFNYNFIFVILGSILIGFGRPFIMNTQFEFACHFFPKEKVVKIVAIVNLFSTVFSAGGAIASSWFFTGQTIDTMDSIIVGRANFRNLLLYVGLFSGSSMLILLTLFRPTRKTEEHKQQQLNFVEQIKKLMSNLSFLTILIAFSFTFGTYNGYGVTIPFLFGAYGFDSGDEGYFLLFPMLGSITGSALITPLVKNKQDFQVVLIFLLTGLKLTWALLYITLITENLWLNSFITFMQGFFFSPAVPLFINWGCMISAPIGSSLTVGILLSVGALTGAVLGGLYTKLSGGENSDHSTILSTIIAIICSYAIATTCTVLFSEKKSKTQDLLINDEQNSSITSEKLDTN